MRIQWRKEWTTPAIVGVSSFAAGVAAGALGYRIKVGRDIDRGLEAMSDIVRGNAKPIYDEEETRIGTIQKVQVTDEGITVSGVVTDPDFIKKVSPANRREGLEYIDNNPTPKEKLVNEFAQGLARQDVPAHPALAVPDSHDLPIVPDEPVVEPDEEPFAEITPQPIITNVFDGDENWNQEQEEALRTTDAPYVLHQNEFFQSQSGYRQQTLEWYEGDSILTDEHQTPIYGWNKIIGSELAFGRGTNNVDTFYVRNDENKAEYEVIRNPASYQVEVMGLQAEEEAEADELRHSQQITRFRMD